MAAMAANGATLAVYGGTTMTDPTLATRLGGIDVPVLVVWGDADRMIEPAVGRAYAAAIPGARFVLLPDTGHLPPVETPQALLHAITARPPHDEQEPDPVEPNLVEPGADHHQP